MDTSKTLLDAIQAADTEQLAKAYREHEMLVIENFLPPGFVIDQFVPLVEKCSDFVHRIKVPGFKKSGSVSYHQIQQTAPALYQLYQSPAMMDFIGKIVGKDLHCCPDRDPHAAALYYYTEPGDRINKHYDKSFYKGGRYTVLLGMIQNSEHSKLVCYPGASKKLPKENAISIATHPGTLVLFNGDVLWHEVTPLAENEKRVILTLEYLTDTRMSLFSKWISDFKDRLLYFGKSEFEGT